MGKVRVLIADDHAVLRSGLRLLLELQGEFEVVGEAENGEQVLKQIHHLSPDIVLMDLAMPGMDGLTAMRRIHVDYPKVKVLVLTQHDDRAYLLPVLQAGAAGYVLKSMNADGLIAALRTVSQGKVFLDPAVAGTVIEGYREQVSSKMFDPYDSMTEREKEVLRLTASGYSSREIAERLLLSPKTIDSYKDRLMTKLGLNSRPELVEYALKRGLLSLPK